MHAVVLALALAAAPPLPLPPAVDAGPPPDPLAEPRALFENRLDRAALDKAVAALDPLQTFDAEVLDARARRFRAVAFELRKRPLHKAEGVVDLEAARQAAIAAWQKVDPSAALDHPENAAPAALPALVELAEADLALAGWRRPLQAVPLLREALTVSARAVALDPDASGAAPRRVHAAALAALPPLAGGDLHQARFEFERAIAAAPNVVANRVEMAARYAVKRQDRALFHALLIAALNTDVNSVPEVRPEQLLARARALSLLHRERELFRG